MLVCGTEPVANAGPLRIAIHHGIDAFAGADTVVVTGRNDVTVDTSNDVLGTLRSAFTAGTRIASICSSAFTLTAAGLFDETMRDDALGYVDPLMLRAGSASWMPCLGSIPSTRGQRRPALQRVLAMSIRTSPTFPARGRNPTSLWLARFAFRIKAPSG